MELENRGDVTASTVSTLNSSSDAPDGDGNDGIKIRYSRTEGNIKFYSNGNIQEINVTKVKKDFVGPSGPRKEHSGNNSLLYLVTIALAAVGVGIMGYLYYFNSHRNVIGATLRSSCSFELSERRFPKQDKKLWESLKFSVESVLNDIPTRPSIFLFAYEDADSAHKITRSIVEQTAECMESRMNALELSPEDLADSQMITDYGVVIKKYQNQLESSGVMLVNDLNKVGEFYLTESV